MNQSIATPLSIWPWQLSHLSFQAPLALLLLLVLPVLVGVYVWMQRRRRRYAVRYASVGLVREAVGRGPGIRRHVPPAIYLAAIAIMVLAIARPSATHPSATSTGDVILVVDVSGSMQATDVNPTRLEATKKALRDFVDKQPNGVKVGLVAFSDFASLLAPPSTDHKQVIGAINRMQPQRGTNMGGGLQVAMDAIYSDFDQPNPLDSSTFNGTQGQGFTFGRPAPAPSPTPPSSTPRDATNPLSATVILLSDGQANVGPDPSEVATEIASKTGIKVNTVGIGTAQGTVLHIQGRSILTQLDEPTLKSIAQATGGKYYNASDSGQLSNVYGQLAREQQTETKRSELTYAVTGLALLLAVIAGGFSLAWFNRLP